MRSFIVTALLAGLTGCGGPTWPTDQFPSQMKVDRILFAEGGGGFRETCVAMVVELNDSSSVRLIYAPKVTTDGPFVASPQNGWHPTPMEENANAPAYFKGAFNGCNNDGRLPLGDLEGALHRPGAYYKLVNHGEGVAVLAPRAKLAGWFYFG